MKRKTEKTMTELKEIKYRPFAFLKISANPLADTKKNCNFINQKKYSHEKT